jgi:hypothetical protein
MAGALILYLIARTGPLGTTLAVIFILLCVTCLKWRGLRHLSPVVASVQE